MSLFISGNYLNCYYYNACDDVLPDDLSLPEHCDFLNMYDGCAFE